MINHSQLNWLTLVILIFATVFNHYWVWGLLFIAWGVAAFRSDNTNLLLPVSRQADPALYWAVNIMWLFFGIWYFLWDVLWRIGVYSIFGYNLYPNG
ncbi:MAG: hypothetical protein AAF423_07410 [Pseudomonadota bacterium]